MKLDDLPQPNPWDSSTWHGHVVMLDHFEQELAGRDALPPLEDVEKLIAAGDSDTQWDGQAAAVVQLKDGAFLGWSTWYQPTGDGFNEDAYGGNQSVYVSGSLTELVFRGLDEEGRRLCGYPENRAVGPVVAALTVDGKILPVEAA